jgi:hypothetical protein
VLNTCVYEFPGSRDLPARLQRLSHVFADGLPSVPALPQTVLALELQLHEFSFDLHAVSQAVLADPGATLQILRLAGQTCRETEDRFVRIEDCISCLGLDACLDAIDCESILYSADRRAVEELWDHSRAVARAAHHLSERTLGEIAPDQAYLGALLHGIGLLPALLRWHGLDITAHPALLGLKIADRWALPAFVRDLLCEMWVPGFDPRWSELLHAAHRHAASPYKRCPCDAMFRSPFPIGA